VKGPSVMAHSMGLRKILLLLIYGQAWELTQQTGSPPDPTSAAMRTHAQLLMSVETVSV